MDREKVGIQAEARLESEAETSPAAPSSPSNLDRSGPRKLAEIGSKGSSF